MYDNLILLCRNHHKLVDDQPETFTESVLLQLKSNHEQWVARTLDSESEPASGFRKPRPQIRLLKTGEEVLAVVAGAHAYDFNHDPLSDEDEVASVGGFLQSAHDWGEIWSDIGPNGHVEAGFDLGRDLSALGALGFLVYGTQTMRRVRVADEVRDDWRVAVLRVLRVSNANVPAHHRAMSSAPSSGAQQS